jgi:hypothetical protein
LIVIASEVALTDSPHTFAKIGMREKPPLDYGIDVAGGEEFSW